MILEMSKGHQYRPEVDGLRALAVLPVIYYHAGFAGLPGGFLGVDVFFVISGYLISRILLVELQSDRFSILSFYERRARRILPALFVVIAVTWPLAYWLMPPELFNVYQGSLWATSLFGSNVFFWDTSGYFQPAAELQPLLHTWSLAVEEQYYLAFPVLLAGLYRWFRPALPTVIAALAIISFSVCLWHFESAPDATFYLIHTRAWELLAGVVVALAQWRGSVLFTLQSTAQNVLATLGLLLIIAGYLLTTPEDPTPGLKTLLPVAGSMLFLGFANQQGMAGKLLGQTPFVAVGLVSYSAYLWHHPLFAFARLYSIDEPALPVMAGLAVLSLLLAAVSWQFVERPWRNKGTFGRQAVFTASLLGICVCVAAGVMGKEFGLAERRIPTQQLADWFPIQSKAEDCVWEHPTPDSAICRFGKANVPNPLVLWGDSHARALMDELNKKLLQEGRSGIFVDGLVCIRTPGIYPRTANMELRAKRCKKAQDDLFAFLQQQSPSEFLVSMRWTMRLFPVPGAGETVGFDNGEGGRESESARIAVALDSSGAWTPSGAAKETAISALLQRLVSLAPVTVVGPVPEVGWHVGNTNFKAVQLHGLPKPDINTSSRRFHERNSFILEVLAKQIASPGIRVVWPHMIFCDASLKDRCIAQSGGIGYYSDEDHLSDHGAKLVLDAIFNAK